MSKLRASARVLADDAAKNKQEKAKPVKQQWLAEKKPSTLNNQSSLLAIYNALHYITIPLACRHLHTPVTFFTAAVDHKWQPYAAWCAHITELLLRHKKPRKMEIMLTRNEGENQSQRPPALMPSHILTH